MNTYRLTYTRDFTEVTNFKTFLKENYPVALDSVVSYIYTKKLLNVDLNMMLTVLM